MQTDFDYATYDVAIHNHCRYRKCLSTGGESLSILLLKNGLL